MLLGDLHVKALAQGLGGSLSVDPRGWCPEHSALGLTYRPNGRWCNTDNAHKWETVLKTFYSKLFPFK